MTKATPTDDEPTFSYHISHPDGRRESGEAVMTDDCVLVRTKVKRSRPARKKNRPVLPTGGS